MANNLLSDDSISNHYMFGFELGHFGQLGHGNDSNYDRPRVISALEPRMLGTQVVQVACGGSHSGVVTKNGMVFMWGLNRSGQTGTGIKSDSVVEPRPIDTSDSLGEVFMANQLVCGRNHSTVITTRGRLYAGGAATFGRLGLTDGRKKVSRPSEVKFFGPRPVARVAIGDFHSLALCDNGELYSWGYNLEGQCGQGMAVNIKSPRRIEFFGAEFRVKEIACGSSWSVVISSSGRAYSWGHGDGGWLCLPSPVPPVISETDIERFIPYDDSTHEDPSKTSGLMHTRSFDSCHNVWMPCPIRIPADSATAPAAETQVGDECVVEGVRCGGSHMILYLSRVRYRRGAIALPKEEALASKSVERVVYHHSSQTVVDSKYDSKSSRYTATSTQLVETTFAEEKGPVRRDIEDRCLNIGMIRDGGWLFTTDSGAVEGDLDLYSVTSPDATNFSISGTTGKSSSFRAAPKAPGIDGLDSDQLQSVLFSWCRHNKVAEMTYALLNRGIFVDSRDASGNTPLMVACQNGHQGLCQMLVEKAKADLNLKNSKGNTALHFCFAFGFQSLGEYLIAKGADEFATNEDGLTCYEGLCAADLERF